VTDDDEKERLRFMEFKAFILRQGYRHYSRKLTANGLALQRALPETASDSAR